MLIVKDPDWKCEIENLIRSKREDDYWDFKAKHHDNKANLLHDIICMANNRVDRDAYIIFGVADDTCEIIGVEADGNRRKQQYIIDQLKSKKFSSGIRPRIEMRTLYVGQHEIDVLIIKNTTDTPYFLVEDFKESGRAVRANHIYTRVGDTNTDIDKSADINNIEYLWKKRFLLVRSPFEQVIKKLEKKNEWKRKEDTYYNLYSPEFTITLEDQDEKAKPAFYSYAMTNESTKYQSLYVNYFETKLYSCQMVFLDSGRYLTPAPEWGFLHLSQDKTQLDYAMKYFTKDDSCYKLNEFFYNENDDEERDARRRFFEVVLLFKDTVEKEEFLKYIHEKKQEFIDTVKLYDGEYSWVATGNKRADRQILLNLKVGRALNRMLDNYRLLHQQ